MRPCLPLLFACLLVPLCAAGGQTAPGTPLEIRVVIVTMFEPGEDTGDAPGELQYWVEREPLPEVLPFAQGYRALRLNREKGVLGIVTGVGNTRAAASMMALGLDPRFDLTHAYFVIAGIAGIDPHVGSLGSVVWAGHVVDGDLAHEIDAREIPQATEADRALWTTGYVPLGKNTPYEQPRKDRFGDDGVRYALDPGLTAWAFGLTQATKLRDTDTMAQRRQQFLVGDSAAPAHRPPFVLVGADLSASTYWHGKLMSAWAHRWVNYQTGGAGTYAVCGMEDSGTLQALTFLAHAGRLNRDRVLVLRSASNYDQQRDGISAAESLAETKVGQYSAYLPALENAWRVGHVAVESLAKNWPETREHIPGTRAAAAAEVAPSAAR